MGSDQRPVPEASSVEEGRTSAGGLTPVPGRHLVGPQNGRSMERFTRPISVSYNLLATVQMVDRIGSHPESVASSHQNDGSTQTAGLVTGHGGRNVFTCKKGGLEVGKTKKGKGTKIMLMIDGAGVPTSAFTTSAQDAEVNTIETLVDVQVAGQRSGRLIYDKAADADWLRDSLEHRGVELITPHRSNRRKASRQDGRSLRRYRHRWKVERTISWLFNYRRLLVRHEHYAHLFEGFVHLACLSLLLNRF
jgi:transposase